MRIRLNRYKNIEIRGRMTRCAPGSIINIGKMLANRWIAEGSAVAMDIPAKAKHKSKKYLLIYIDPAKLPNPSELMLAVREFWFNNESGIFDLDEHPVSRAQVQLHGGPNPEFNACSQCQTSEWLSRIYQQNFFLQHSCPTAKLCQTYCARQGKDQWTHYHQCFWFAAFCDAKLNAPRVAMVHHSEGRRYVWSHHCDHSTHVFLRQFAQVCQFDVLDVSKPVPSDLYDFVFVTCDHHLMDWQRPENTLLLMYGHDMWKRRPKRQAVIDRLTPDYFWTPYYSSWRAHYKFPSQTRVCYRPMPMSQFFTRPSLDDSTKTHVLLSIGCKNSPIYGPRARLAEQIQAIAGKYKVRFSHGCGAKSANVTGPNITRGMNFANAFSRELSKACFVIFDGIAEEPQPVFPKYFEVIGSGAIPIMPDAPDLALVGIKAWEHFIPVSEVRGNNARLCDILDHYADYKNIAQNAVDWHERNADRLLFEGFEDLVQEMTEGKYPKRVY